MFAEPSRRPVALNIHHWQDWLNATYLLDFYMPSDVVVLLRKQNLQPDERDAVLASCDRLNVRFAEFTTCKEIDWSALGCAGLISFAEGTLAWNHALSSQLVFAARLQNLPTVLLQHGIQVETPSCGILAYASDAVLTWGEEHRDFIQEVDRKAEATFGTSSLIDTSKIRPGGSVKYRTLIAAKDLPMLHKLIGREIDPLTAVVLFTTNLRWGAHRVENDAVIDSLRSLVDRYPDIHFLGKVHPNERASLLDSINAANFTAVDDIELTKQGIKGAQLIASSDIIISSLSTVLLDAAIAGKRCIQYATSNAYSYEDCLPVDLANLETAFADGFRSLDPVSFSNRYASHRELAIDRAIEECFARTYPADKVAECYGYLGSLEQLSLHSGHLSGEVAHLRGVNEEHVQHAKEMSSHIVQLDGRIAQLEEKAVTLAEEIQQGLVREADLTRQYRAVTNSRTWRYTASIRSILNQVRGRK